MNASDVSAKQAEKKNQERKDRQLFVENAAIAALQGILANQSSWDMAPAKAAEIAHSHAKALADSLRPLK